MPRNTEKQEVKELIYYDAISQILLLWEDHEKVMDIIFETELAIYRINQITKTLPKQLNWTQDVLPRMGNRHFKSMLRVTHVQFERILDMIKDHEVFKDKNGLQFSVPIQLAIVLFRLGHYGNGASLDVIASLFGIGQGSTITRVTRLVFKAILALEKHVIYWPDEEERRELECPKLPGCSFFMDGTAIKLEDAPVADKESYFDKDKNYSVKINIICDSRKRIRHFNGVYPGSCHDGKLHGDSHIGQHPELYLNPGQYIVADKAYNLSQYIITPFRENSRDLSKRSMRAFNKYISRFRVWVEHLNGALKETFQSLYELRIRIHDRVSYEEATNWVVVCLILYNIILPLDNFKPTGDHNMYDEEDDDFTTDTQDAGRRRRLQIAQWVLN